MFLSKAKPFLRNFICGSISILIVWNVPGAAGGLNNGVISRDPLKNTKSSVTLMITNDYTMSLHSQTYLKPNPFSWGIITDYQLMSTLPLEEEASGCSVWQAGFVIPHQITTKKVTVNARVQSSIQQKRVIFRPVEVIQEKPCTGSKIPFMLDEWNHCEVYIEWRRKGKWSGTCVTNTFDWNCYKTVRHSRKHEKWTEPRRIS